MFKEIRSLLNRLEGLGADSSNDTDNMSEPTAIELPQSIEPAPGDRHKPHIFVFDPNPSSARSLAALLTASGVEVTLFAEGAAFAQAFQKLTPAMVFIDVSGQGDEAIDALFAMGRRNYTGSVQLMGGGTMPVIEVVRRMGQRHALQMRPVLKKPIGAATLRQVLTAQRIKLTPVMPAPVSLEEALAKEWIEFWYQPKIDLAKKQIAGVETFARVLHPQFGTLSPAVFMQGATEADLVRLTQKALGHALSAAANFSSLGINLRLAVNMPVRALLELPISGMVRKLGPKHSRWPGLLIDVTEAQVVGDLQRVQTVSARLAEYNVRLAIDDFGRGMLPLAQLRALPFTELKLDRSFVNGCANDPARLHVCRSAIELAHHLGCIAVAVGVEKAADMRALAGLGCDLGQGFLFGPPVPEAELVNILLKRAVLPEPQATRPLRDKNGPRRARWD